MGDAGSGSGYPTCDLEIYSEDYSLIEYGMTEKDLQRAIRNLNKAARHEETTRWDGTPKSLRG